MVYKDENGYLRDKEDGGLVHRKVAFKKFQENPEDYDMPFSKYEIHHVDGDKLNNTPDNLEIVTKEEHRRIHNIVDNSNISYSNTSSFGRIFFGILFAVMIILFWVSYSTYSNDWELSVKLLLGGVAVFMILVLILYKK